MKNTRKHDKPMSTTDAAAGAFVMLAIMLGILAIIAGGAA